MCKKFIFGKDDLWDLYATKNCKFVSLTNCIEVLFDQDLTKKTTWRICWQRVLMLVLDYFVTYLVNSELTWHRELISSASKRCHRKHCLLVKAEQAKYFSVTNQASYRSFPHLAVESQLGCETPFSLYMASALQNRKGADESSLSPPSKKQRPVSLTTLLEGKQCQQSATAWW